MGQCPGHPGAPFGYMPPGAVQAKVLGTGPSYPVMAPTEELTVDYRTVEPAMGGLGPGHPPVEVMVAGASARDGYGDMALVPTEMEQALTRLNGLGMGAAGAADEIPLTSYES